MHILLTICARGGSKGIPGKNIKELGGKPLIAYSIAMARKFQALISSDLELSTDSAEIREVAGRYGLHTDFNRSPELANDKIGKVDAIEDLLYYAEQKHGCRYDYVLDLDVSSPMRTLEDLQNGFQLIENQPEAYNLFSVSPAHRNPYFNMVEDRGNGYVKLVKEGETFFSRQAAPRVYDINGSFYFYRRSFFQDKIYKVINQKSMVYAMDHVCFDLDHPEDYEYLSWLLDNRKLNFQIE